MTKRERFLLFALTGVIAIVGGFFLLIKWFRDPLQDAEAKARTAAGKFVQLSSEWNKLLDGKKDLHRWRLIGLSTNTDTAITQYAKYLQHSLLERSGLTYSKVESSPGGKKRMLRDSKKPSHTALNYSISARGKLDNLVQFMRDFYRTALPHKIKTLRVDRATRESGKEDPELSITMEIEVLVVHADEGRPADFARLVTDVVSLVGRGNTPVTMVPWRFSGSEPYVFKSTEDRLDGTQLAQLAQLNVFQGYIPPPPPKPKRKTGPKVFVKKERPPPPPPQPGFDMRPYMRLTSINISEEDVNGFPGTYATFQNLLKPIGSDEAFTSIAARSGYDIIQIMDEKEVELQLYGRVLLVDHRDVYVQQWADANAKTLLASTVGLSHSPLPCSPLATAAALVPGRMTVYQFHIGENFKMAMEQPVYYGELWENGVVGRMADAAAKRNGPFESEVSSAAAE